MIRYPLTNINVSATSLLLCTLIKSCEFRATRCLAAQHGFSVWSSTGSPRDHLIELQKPKTKPAWMSPIEFGQAYVLTASSFAALILSDSILTSAPRPSIRASLSDRLQGINLYGVIHHQAFDVKIVQPETILHLAGFFGSIGGSGVVL